MKEMWKKYKRQIQIGGGICLIAALGIGGYVAGIRIPLCRQR